MTDRVNPVSAAGAYASGGAPGGPPNGRPPGGTGHSPWWTDALNDPWRDPVAPAVVVHQPAAAGPPLDAPPRPRPAWSGGGLRLVFLVAVVSALLAGTLGGTLGYVFAVRNGVGTGGAIGQTDTRTAPLTNRPPTSLAGVVQRVMPSVATILVSNANERGNGSGFVVSPDGYLITNEHVAAVGATGSISVRFSDGTTVAARRIGGDAEADVAVLKVDKQGLTPVTFGDSDKVAVGDPVLAVGSPLGLTNTVTSGIVSALDRPVRAGSGTSGDPESFYAAIQTDAAINHGNSGGPLVDAGGRVIGINSAIQTGTSDEKAGNIGIGFAIPIDQARRIAQEIIQTGRSHHTVIGASVDTGYQETGARLASVVANGPAAKGGLRGGDVITRFNGRVIEDETDLVAQIRKQAPGTVVPVDYIRGGALHTTEVTLVADGK